MVMYEFSCIGTTKELAHQMTEILWDAKNHRFFCNWEIAVQRPRPQFVNFYCWTDKIPLLEALRDFTKANRIAWVSREIKQRK